MTGRDLRQWREAKGLLQREAAKALGVGLRAIQLAEKADADALGPKLRRRLAARLTRDLADEPASTRARNKPVVLTTVRPELVEALRNADTAEELLDFEKRLAHDSADGKLELRLAAFLLDACREMRQTLHARNREHGQTQLAELEILTLDEAEDLRALRASKTPKALAPGEAPAPPSAAPPPPPPAAAKS